MTEPERFELVFPGKQAAKQAAKLPPQQAIHFCREESLCPDISQNLYIEGDNLEALRHLQETHAGRIKAVIIDPPYNTGGDFVYRDRFRTAAGYPDDATRMHADWCSMMYSRLMLARNILSPDGLIFISIGSAELDNLINAINTIFSSS